MRPLIVSLSILLLMLQGCAGIPKTIKQGDDYFLRKAYEDALQAYEIGLPKIKDAKSRQEVAEKINLIKGYITDQHLADARLVYDRQAEKTIPMLDEALAVLEKGVGTDDQAGRIAATMADYQDQRKQLQQQVTQNLTEAAAKATAYQFSEAIELIDDAIRLDPQNSVLQENKLRLEEQKALYAAIEIQIENGDLENTFHAYDQFAKAAGIKPDLKDFPLENEIVTLILKKAEALTDQKKYYRAYLLLTHYPLDALMGALDDVKREGSQYYLNAAKSAVNHQYNYAKGYVYASLANEMNPNDFEVFNIHKVTQDRVDRNVQKYIAVASFDAPSNDPDSGKQFSDSLISYLYQVLPYGINILERDKIDYVLKEQGTEAKTIGEMLGVDLMVTGTVSLFKVDKSVDERMATVKVKVGEETVTNPEFVQMLNMFGSDMSQWPIKMQQIYGQDASKWPKLPPKTIQKENFEMINYKRGTAQMKGFAKVSIRIFDTTKGTIMFVKDFDATVEKSGEFQDEVKEADIAYIPDEPAHRYGDQRGDA